MHFYADITGNRGNKHVGGSKESGITGHIRGMDVGIRVECKHEMKGDTCYVYATRGSNHNPILESTRIATVRYVGNGWEIT